MTHPDDSPAIGGKGQDDSPELSGARASLATGNYDDFAAAVRRLVERERIVEAQRLILDWLNATYPRETARTNE